MKTKMIKIATNREHHFGKSRAEVHFRNFGAFYER